MIHYLGDGRDGRPRVVTTLLLINANGWRQSLDAIAVGLLHLTQELPGIGGEALDVSPLPLCVQGVEGQTGLPASRDPGEHNELAPGDLDVYVPEIVGSGASDDDPVPVVSFLGRGEWRRHEPIPSIMALELMLGLTAAVRSARNGVLHIV